MTELESRIIEAAENIRPINGYGYKSYEDLRVAIAEVMGYEIRISWRYGKQIAKLEDYDKVHAIINGMKRRNLIVLSKAGTTFKMARRG